MPPAISCPEAATPCAGSTSPVGACGLSTSALPDGADGVRPNLPNPATRAPHNGWQKVMDESFRKPPIVRKQPHDFEYAKAKAAASNR